MFTGDGRNGKGKTVEIIKHFLGADNCANVPIQQFETDGFSIAEFFNKLVNIAADISKTALKETGYFKSLTGRDLISAQRKFLPRVHFVNYAKLIFCANELPTTYDSTMAFWNRWVLIEFPYTFVSKKEYDMIEDKTKFRIADPEIIQKIVTPEELSGLLNWSLVGLQRLLKNMDFSYSKSTEDVKTLWIRKSNSFQAFILDEIDYIYDGKISKSELRMAYGLYCKEHKLVAVTDKTIKYSLSMGGAAEERSNLDGLQVACWGGVKFKNSKGSEDSNGFSTPRRISNSPIGVKQVTTLTTLTKCSLCGLRDSISVDKNVCQDCFNDMPEKPLSKFTEERIDEHGA